MAAQAARDLDVHENVLRKWGQGVRLRPGTGVPSHGQMKPEQQEIERLGREVNKLKAERDILKKRPSLLREGIDMKFVFIAKHRMKIHKLLSRSGHIPAKRKKLCHL